MKTITVEELHAQTDRVVSEAAPGSIAVTKNGRPRAILKPYPDEAALKRHGVDRERMLTGLPAVAVDSTDYISEDRNER